MGADADFIGGHGILALERFMDETRHMIIFDVLTWEAPVGDKGERLRLFLSDEGYAKAQASEKRGEIKIRKHAAIIEGHILADRSKSWNRQATSYADGFAAKMGGSPIRNTPSLRNPGNRKTLHLIRPYQIRKTRIW